MPPWERTAVEQGTKVVTVMVSVMVVVCPLPEPELPEPGLVGGGEEKGGGLPPPVPVENEGVPSKEGLPVGK